MRRRDETCDCPGWLICTAIMSALTTSAFAADLDDALRGSETVGPATFRNWTGFYGGGQIGYSNDTTDFSNATSSLVKFSLRNTTLEQEQQPSSWTTLTNASTSKATYGAYARFNTQFGQIDSRT